MDEENDHGSEDRAPTTGAAGDSKKDEGDGATKAGKKRGRGKEKGESVSKRSKNSNNYKNISFYLK